MASERVIVDLDPTMKRRVELVAKRHNTTVPEWIEESLRRELERDRADNAFSHASVPSFARDWDTAEDAVYDEPGG